MTAPAAEGHISMLDGPAAEEPSLRDLYENAPCGYLSATVDGDIVSVNDTFLRWTGHLRDDLIGRPFNSVLSVGSRLLFETRCLPLLHLEGEAREVALELRCGDDRSLRILANFSVARPPGGPTSVIRAAIFDASERQDYERDLLQARRVAQRSELQTRILQQGSTAFGATDDVATVAAALAEHARAAFDATATAVMTFDEDSGTWRTAAGSPDVAELALSGAGSPADEAVRLGRTVSIVSIDDAERSFPDAADRLYAARFSALTVTPLLHGSKALGVLLCCFGRTRSFDDQELQLKAALVQQASSALVRIHLQDQLRFQAAHDRLTGLANRELLHHRLAEALSSVLRPQRPLALLFLDLDGFKAINDRLGHLVGDAVLVEIAERLRMNVRKGDMVARFGGDEFLVLCDNSDWESTRAVSRRLRDAVRQPLAVVGHQFPLTTSVGVVVYQPEGCRAPGPELLLKAADDAMYQSKMSGKDRETLVRFTSEDC